MDQRDFFDKDIATQGNLESYFVVELGSYVYNPRISITAPVGPVSKNKIGTGVMSPLYTVFKFKDDNNAFYEHYFKTTGWHTYMRQASSTGARHDRMAISSDDFMAMPLPVSTLKEQQKIADCLSSLDELIAAQARKVDALKTYKKGLMQQLFPREGETQPRLRFPELRSTGDWEVKRLNQLLFETKTRNRNLELGPVDVLSVSGEYGCVNQIEHLGRSYAGVSVKDYHVVERGDVVYTKSPLKKNPYGIVKENKGKRGIVSTLYAVYRPYPECSASYLDHFFSVAYNLNSYLQPIVKKGAKNDMKVNNADVLKGEISVPRFEEQRKIADCLSSMDAAIAAETQVLKTLKTQKNGLLQQLFPSADAVDA
jgi:type I restriction enzyme, S subunit